jgi:SRSO17 transposase
VSVLATGHGRQAFTEVTWREGSRGPMRSHFLALRVRPAGVRSRRLAQAAATAEHGHRDGVLPEVTLLVQWPEDAQAPTDYWLSSLPADTPIAELVRLAKIRWRIEHDYRELKHGLGLDHFEGRSWTGWRIPHRTATGPKSRYSGLTLYQILDTLQDLLNCWTGTCTTCNQPLPSRPHTTSKSRQT